MNTRKRSRDSTPVLVGTGIITNQNIARLIKLYVNDPKHLPVELNGFSISNWDVSAVTNMSNIFANSPINVPLDNWDVSNVTDMSFMFYKSDFNHPLETWNVSEVTDMSSMFSSSQYNHPLEKWNVSKVKDMKFMFSSSQYNHPLNDWNVSLVSNMRGMFRESQYNHPLAKWNVSSLKDMAFMFSSSQYNHPLENWQFPMGTPGNVSLGQDMSAMFDNSQYNHPLGSWNVSRVVNMRRMFTNSQYNHPLGSWNVSQVKDMSHMFEDSKYNHPLEQWNISNVEDMSHMFEESQYNHSLEQWTPNRVVTIDSMFDGCVLNPLPSWYDDTEPREDRSEKNNQTTTVNNSSGIKKSYKDLFRDSTYDKFDQLMAPFQSNPTQIVSPHLYITDQILANINNPHLVHYETLSNGSIYPIITIPKGAMLFTGRANISTDMTNSYSHLYKLLKHQTLDAYSDDDFANTLTYFFPFPYLSNLIDLKFKSLDMVVLTKDIRLLCLISPSPLERGYKAPDNKQLYNGFEKGNKSMITTCTKRLYDLCINKQLIIDLKLNGYIGIANEDSVSNHLEKLSKSPLEKILSQIPQSNSSALYDACCFNNAFYPPKRSYHELTFLKEMKTTRTYGVPEIVLIPYDIHAYPDPAEYISVKKTFNYSPQKNDPHFIFRHEHHVTGKNSIHISKQMGNDLAKSYPLGTVIGKSMLAPTLITVLLSEVDADKQDYVTVNPTATLEELSFANSYLPTPSSKCAFELMAYYNRIQPPDATTGTTTGTTSRTGGRRVIRKTQRRRYSSTQTHRMRSNQSLLGRRKTRTRPIRIYQRQKLHVLVDLPTAYYSEVNGIPIVAI